MNHNTIDYYQATPSFTVSLWLEAQDVILLIKLMVDPPNNFYYISYVSSSTRASSQYKLQCVNPSIPHINATKHFFFNRVVRLWNALPPIDTGCSFISIKRHIFSIFWQYFSHSYSVDRPCTWHIVCPCSICSKLPSSSFQINLNQALLNPSLDPQYQH